MNQPIIAITMGDAAGVGPEIIMKALAHREVYERCKPLIIGDANRLRQAGEIVGSSLKVRTVSGPKETVFEYGSVDCVDLGLILHALAGQRTDCSFSDLPRTATQIFNPQNRIDCHAGGRALCLAGTRGLGQPTTQCSSASTGGLEGRRGAISS